MSSRPSQDPSPSNSPEPTTRRASSVIPEASNPATPSNGRQSSAETPQQTAGPRSRSTPPNFVHAQWNTRAITSNPRGSAPLLIITESTEPRNSPQSASASRQGRPLVARHLARSSSSQPPRRSTTPYSRPTSRPRSSSQPRSEPTTSTAMSSASSSPANTSTAGATSSNPSYQLPYAPFPYPMPANGRGSGGQGQQGSGGSGGK